MKRRASLAPLAAFALFLSLGAYTAPASAQQPTALQVLEGAAARYRSTSAFCADFIQERTIPLLNQKMSGRGRLCQKQPNFFMMRFTEPQGDRLIADGEFFWHYTPSTDARQVIQMPMARVSNAGGSYDFRTEFLDNPAEKYQTRLDGQETVDGGQAHRVVLIPRRATSFKEAVLWIDSRSSLVRRVELREENGSIHRVSLLNTDLNATPPADAFRFTPPAGVQVLKP